MFISVEGPDGAGKTTMIEGLAARLTARGLAVNTLREPGGTCTGRFVRKLLVSGLARRIDSRIELVALYAARRCNTDSHILPALKANRWIISDRFYDSSKVYQVEMLDDKHLRAEAAYLWDYLQSRVVGNVKPSITFVLDAPAETLVRRLKAREEHNLYDQRTLAEFDRLRQCYKEIANAEPDRVHVIDAEQCQERILESALAKIDDKLSEMAK